LTNKLISEDNLAASLIYLKDKEYYDFEFNIEVLAKSEGKFGIAFRIRDPFNYYAFVLNKKAGTKSLVRVINGKQVDLTTLIYDGGYLVNQWLQVTVLTKANKITVKYSDQLNKVGMKVLEAFDSFIAGGSVGVFSNAVEGLYFDNMKAISNSCWNAWEPKKNLTILTPYSNIYSEDLNGSLLDKYDIYDPEEYEDGPSQWFLRTYGKDQGILQNTKIYDKSPVKRPSFILLKSKIIKYGTLRVVFTPDMAGGAISILFKYNKSNQGESYYSLSFVNSAERPSESQITLISHSNGVNSTLKSIESMGGFPDLRGYKPGAKHDIIISIINSEIRVLLSLDNKKYEEVFNVTEENKLTSGQVGFGTYKTPALFTILELTPPQLSLTPDEVNKILEKESPDIYFPSLPKDNIIKPLLSKTEYDKLKDSISSGWSQKCIKSTYTERQAYCQTLIKATDRYECNNNFCDTCCSTETDKTNVRSLCRSKCNEAPLDEIKNKDYKNTCVSPVTENSIYEYCNVKFADKLQNIDCKVDMCRLCCVNLDIIKGKVYEIEDCVIDCFTSKINYNFRI
jgi:hypothetical protein